MKWTWCAVVLLGLYTAAGHAQANDASLTAHEVETLRDTADLPAERLKAYEGFLDDREKQLDAVVKKRHGAEFTSDVHDLLQQFSSIADELNDNLDEWDKQHRDVRKPLPKLLQATGRWATSLRAPERDERYEIVRREALDAVNDTHTLAASLLDEETGYFKQNPDKAAEEKRRAESPNAPE